MLNVKVGALPDLGCRVATFWEIAARSVSNLFSLYIFCLFVIFIYYPFGFKSMICLLIAPVPVHCFSITIPKKSHVKRKQKSDLISGRGT